LNAFGCRQARAGLLALCLPLLAACQAPPQGPSPASPPPPHAELVRVELDQLVASQQPPCGAVLEYTRHGRLDYRVACESGQVYRVRVSADGRVEVKPYEPPQRATVPR
jgi:hypothetical protein